MDAPQEELYGKYPIGSSIASILEAVDGATGALIEGEPCFVPYHDENVVVYCWDCHGFVIGPPGRRLCHCQDPGPLSPTDAETLRSLEALRDALAETLRVQLFKLLLPMLDGAAEDEARAAWDSLWGAARSLAARRLAEEGSVDAGER
jgi:hypothetical protein